MVSVSQSKGCYLLNNETIIEDLNQSPAELNKKIEAAGQAPVDEAALDKNSASNNTMAWSILKNHNQGPSESDLNIRFDALASHDITYVGIIQTARASGLKQFPVPYVLTNCHNSLCAVGGTINEDDHRFGLSAAKKYGGIFVPAHLAVIHQYMREMMAGCGKMILGSDSHTRYGALGTMAMGEGGPEIVKQLLERTYDITRPEVIAVYLSGAPRPGVGPQDVALAIIKAVFESGYVKNKVMEFVGPGIANLTMDYRNGIDVMTTETTCLSSIWVTDDAVKEYYRIHERETDFTPLKPGAVTFYDGLVRVELDKVEPMIALPFHPSNVYTIKELNENPGDILKTVEKQWEEQKSEKAQSLNLSANIKNGSIVVDQGVIAGCAGGTFENIMSAVEILKDHDIGNDAFTLSVYPASQPLYSQLTANGAAQALFRAGSIVRSAFCGPCFGAGDTPSHQAFSVRHVTRNFPNREGSKPADNQIAAIALMDARSIAATAANKGVLTAATDMVTETKHWDYAFDKPIYEKRVFFGFNSPDPTADLVFGPNIVDWPQMTPLPENLLLSVAAYITDPVTTTDELIPSGETSSYRSNPLRLAQFTLGRKDPEYVGRATTFNDLEISRRNMVAGDAITDEEKQGLSEVFTAAQLTIDSNAPDTGLGTVIFAVKPGDGSAREQAASCQKVLGGWANIAVDYATKRYRSNVINWGMIPFILNKGEEKNFACNDLILIEGIREAVQNNADSVHARVFSNGTEKKIALELKDLTAGERAIILAGCLINYYKENQ